MENWAKNFAANFADHKRLEAEVASNTRGGKMHWLMKRTLCRWVGHRFGIKGVTGKYEWCERCATRRQR